MAVEKITKANFEEKAKAPGTALLDFWAPWCGPCRMVAPIVEAIAEENPDILVGKVDVDEEMELAMEFSVTSIPTLVVLKDGQPVSRMVGYRPKEEILDLLGK